MTNPMWQALGPAESRNDSEVDLRLSEARLFARDDQIAGQRQFESATQGESVDGGNYRNRQLLEGTHHTMPEASKLKALDGLHVGHRGNIGARNKGAIAGPGDYQYADGRVVTHVTQHASDLLQHGAVERIERLGPVDCDGRDCAGFKNQVFHQFSSLTQGIG